MTEVDLYDYLLKMKDRDFIITFEDGDQYYVTDIDFCFNIGLDGRRDDEPLDVSFDDCIDRSRRREQAIAEGRLKTPGVSWTSSHPSMPIAMTYSVRDIRSIWDCDKHYHVYERHRPA